jgi:hypothetical protein
MKNAGSVERTGKALTLRVMAAVGMILGLSGTTGNAKWPN